MVEVEAAAKATEARAASAVAELSKEGALEDRDSCKSRSKTTFQGSINPNVQDARGS